MRTWALGIVLGIVLTLLAFWVIAGLLEGARISARADSDMHAFALVVLIMLCVVLLRQTPGRRPGRIIQPRRPEEDQG